MIIKLSLTLSSNRLQNLALPQPHQPPCLLSVFSDWVIGDSPLCIVYIIPQHSTLLAYGNLNGPLLLLSLRPGRILCFDLPPLQYTKLTHELRAFLMYRFLDNLYAITTYITLDYMSYIKSIFLYILYPVFETKYPVLILWQFFATSKEL